MDSADSGFEDLVTRARDQGPRGEVVLRSRRTEGGWVEELVVNGAFAMDSAETGSEQALAALALGDHPVGARVLVGGLGLGFTTAAVLDHDVDRVDVVELERAIVTWAREGRTPLLAFVAQDPRVRLHVGDVAQVLDVPTAEGLNAPAGPWEAICLDVDNGPDFLIHDANADLYRAPLLTAALRRLTPGGTLAIWCQGPTPELLATCRTLDPTAREHRVPTRRGRHVFDYAIYTLRRPASASPGG